MAESWRARWKTLPVIIALVGAGKGLSFLREAFVASQLGASASSDGYYLALAMPTLVYSLGALPFSMWVTARLSALRGLHASQQAASFYSRVVMLGFGAGAVLALALAATAHIVVSLYAPGLDPARLDEAASLTRIGALAIPALALQAICNGRLYADGRFLPVYVWLVISSIVGLGVVVVSTPHYGAAAAVWAFVAAAWTSIVGPIAMTRPTLMSPTAGTAPDWVEDLGVSVVYRALVMQVYFQACVMLTYGFGSTLPTGELAASQFGSKVQNAMYESLVVTAGAFVYPQIAHFLQKSDYAAARRTIVQALNWLLPATAALVVLLITCRREIVALIYERHAFDDRAAQLVGAALLGFAPGMIGLTLVEIFHRTMVLRGQLKGYVLVFGGALAVNWLCNHLLVPRLGVFGLTLSSSLSALVGGIGLLAYASRRLGVMDRQMLLLIIRTAIATGLALAAVTLLHGTMGIGASSLAELVTVAVSGVAVGLIVLVALLALGHRWQLVS
ncbi:MAG TPA: lipid II flippase MurJ [Anaeromyxobacteraceae bacterium]|nr:lipid II flippase MurJ [Anaeromyxobacteraceae bacterium]